jgi:hypothetical protein
MCGRPWPCPDAPPYVEKRDGQLLLHDPQALAIAKAVNRSNALGTFELNKDRIAHFKARSVEIAAARGLTPDDMVIVILNVNDRIGGQLAEALMPGYDWQSMRDRGEIPFARGLATRAPIQHLLDVFDPDAADTLRAFVGLAVVVIDYDVARIHHSE